MLINYKNSNLILNGALPVSGQRIDLSLLNILKVKYYLPELISTVKPEDNTNTNTTIEYHLYTQDGGYLASNHNVLTWKNTFNKNLNQVELDVHQDTQAFGFIRGIYKFVYNFHKDFIGSYNSNSKLFVYDISTTRRELKLRLTDKNDTTINKEISKFINEVNLETDIWKSYILNFGQNKILNVLNISIDESTKEIYIRLYEPLPSDIKVNNICFISSELMDSYVDKITLVPIETQRLKNSLKGPNFDIDTEYVVNQETDFKNWSDLVASGSSSQQLIEAMFGSEVLRGARINIDFSDLKEFVHFSSAEERLDNFMYKLKLLEYYEDRLSDLILITGSSVGEYKKTIDLKNNTIKTFDEFEKYLYFGISGSLYTHPGIAAIEPYPKIIDSTAGIGQLAWYNVFDQWSLITQQWSNLTGSMAIIDSGSLTYPFKLKETQDEGAITWYYNAKDVAKQYDKGNLNALRWFLPGHIIDDPINESAVTFIDMLGHHYDTLWLYIKTISKLHSHEEHIKDGTSPDLLYNVAKNYGWTLTNGKQTKELWETFFGISKDNLKIQSGSFGIQSLDLDISTKQVWKRIVNNLPDILKTKGSNRSVKSLISSYGIPSSILYSKEYGGPSTTKLKSDLKLNKFQYALKIKPTNSIKTPFKKIIYNNKQVNYDSIYLRQQNYNYNILNYGNINSQLILSKNDATGSNLFYISLDYDNNEYHKERANINWYVKSGSVYLTSSINNVDLLDGDFYNIHLQRQTSSLNNNINNEYKLYLTKTKYGKVLLFNSSSLLVNSGSYNINELWNQEGELVFGYDSNLGITNHTGSIREIRLWVNKLDDDVIRQHSKASRSYVGNSPTSSYYDLRGRFILGNNNINFGDTTYLSSQHPNKNLVKFYDSSSISASFSNFGVAEYYGFNEDLNYVTPTIGGQNFLSTKIRIEDQQTFSNLKIDKRSTIADYDDQPLDSSKLVIAFSPQDTINEDIISHIGDANLDDYIGNPADVYKDEYPNLQDFSVEYWKKYENRNDFNAFFKLISIYDFGVFEQIKQVLPLRANKILGTLIEPNLLERNKIKTNTIPKLKNNNITNYDDLGIFVYDIKSDINLNIESNDYENLNIYNISSDIDLKFSSSLDKLSIYTISSDNNSLYNSELDSNIYNLFSTYNDNNTNLKISKSGSSSYINQSVKKVNNVWINTYTPEHVYRSVGIIIDNYLKNTKNLKKVYFYSTYESASLKQPSSSSLENSIYDHPDSLPTGLKRNRYSGCTIYTSSIDGRFAVEINQVDPNTITYTGDLTKQDGAIEII